MTRIFRKLFTKYKNYIILTNFLHLYNLLDKSILRILFDKYKDFTHFLFCHFYESSVLTVYMEWRIMKIIKHL